MGVEETHVETCATQSQRIHFTREEKEAEGDAAIGMG